MTSPDMQPGNGIRALKRTSDNQLAYRDSGPDADARGSILLVHGWGVSGALFEGQLAALAPGFRVVAPDLPGHGDSAAFPRGAGFGWLAESVAALVAELQLREIVLVGWSLGAMVAWDLLLRHPGLPVKKLVTIDMVPRLLNDADWSYGLREGHDHHVFDRNIRWMLDDWAGYTALFVPRIFARGGSARERGLLAQTQGVAQRNNPHNMARIWSLMVEQDFRRDIQQIRVPTLVVSGALSQLYGQPAGDWIVQRMPCAMPVLFGASGHAPHLEEPDTFNRALSAFAGRPDHDATENADGRHTQQIEL